MMKKNILQLSPLILFFILTIPITVFAQQTVSGHIYFDKNNNGLFDADERGVKNLLVSNGVEIVKTNKKGEFKISIKKGQSIFPVLPSEYKIVGRKSSKVRNANFYYFHPDSILNDTRNYTFLVQKKESSDKFRVGAVGDIQVDNTEELGFAAKSIGSELANRKDIDFNIILGDLVNDKMNLLSPVKDLLENLPNNSWTLLGNHDRDVTKESAMNNMFNSCFGAEIYAFNYGKIHFIVLNNVFPTGKRTYEGRITDEQLQFIKNDLSHVGKDRTIVISQHIPMYGTRNRNEVFKLLDGYKNVLVLSGHTHVVSRHFYNNGTIHEIGAGATCGTWWRGEKNSDGIPDAVMQCGSPRGYFVIDFEDNNYSFQYKGVGLHESKKMRTSLDSNKLVVNIFGGSDSSIVKYQIDNGPMQYMTKTRMVDPYVSYIIQKNKTKIYPTLGNTLLPLREQNSNHIWTASLPSETTQKVISLKIFASDKFGFKVEESFIYFL